MKYNVFRLILFSLILSFCKTIPAQTESDAAATGISRAFNPAISVNALFSGMASDNENLLWSDF